MEVYQEKMIIDSFWHVITSVHDNPNLIHSCTESFQPMLILEVAYNTNETENFLNLKPGIFDQLKEVYNKNINIGCLNHVFVKNLFVDEDVLLIDTTMQEYESSVHGCFISVQTSFGSKRKLVQFCILNKQQSCASFYLADVDTGLESFFDIKHTVLGKLVVFVENPDFDVKPLASYIQKLAKPQHRSLCLISASRYEVIYKNLKKKYSRELVKNWTERTDPLKYVYEDIGIASYLISLWEKTHPGKKPSFVDLGCGNGLLVHLLNQEGFPGLGIDIRKRNIWDTFPATTCLKEQVILPNADFLFPNCDWIIGNHSDELTPWVPVIASRSSYKTNFFLLPCCCYEFNGRKFNRINTGRSTYEDYMEFLHNFCRVIQFSAEKDCLKIPSTKRRCLVGFGREYKEELLEDVNRKIDDFINKRQNVAADSDWTSDIKVRECVERVRNCTQVDKAVLADIIKKVVSLLLTSKNVVVTRDGREWNVGGSASFEQIAKEVGKDLLFRLKSECGGLQTLLKNHRYIFVVEQLIWLRRPSTLGEVGDKYKSKPCWFKINHPDGCCNTETDCAYNHRL